MGRERNSIKENAEVLFAAGKDIGLEINADKHQNAGRSHSMKNEKS